MAPDTQSLIHDRSDDGLLYFRPKIPVAVLGATGSVGQRLVARLATHPWFELAVVAASPQSVGKPYREAATWMSPTPLPEAIGKLVVQPCDAPTSCKIVFSALDASVAKEVDPLHAAAGALVLSAASCHRMEPLIPLLVPEINSDQLELGRKQPWAPGMIIAKPNCAVTGLTLALQPLVREFGVEACQVVTLQSASGAGFPGVSSTALLDNIIPYIEGEEAKIEEEPSKIFGMPLQISATALRVPVTEGHMAVVSVRLKQKATHAQVAQAWRDWESPLHELALPSAPPRPVVYFEEPSYPQPKLHRDLEKGMAVSVGRLRDCPLMDYSFVTLSHNLVRGAAGGMVLAAELLVKKGFVFW